MKTAVVILNWNGRKLLEEFLPSVIKHSQGANLYVADNNSTDDSVSFLRTNFPQVKLILLPENGGYAKGYNEALKQVEADIFVLLNSDVEVTDSWLIPVLAEFERDPSVAAAQPKILNYRNKEYFEYAGAAGGFLDKYAFPFCRGRIFNNLEKDRGQYDDTSRIFWASGACLFVRAKDFWKAGGFDEDYFAHQEEIDLCWRLNSMGKEIKCVGASAVYHLGGGTLNSLSPRKTYLNFRNSLFNLYKNRKRNIFFVLFIRLSMDGLAGIRFLLQIKPIHTWQILKAHFSFYRNLPRMRKKRKLSAGNTPYFFIQNLPIQFYIKKRKSFNDLR